GGCFQLSRLGHRPSRPGPLLPPPAETVLRDVVLARPAVFAGLADEGLLANGLSHGLALVSSVDARSRLIGRRACGAFILCSPGGRQGRPMTNSPDSACRPLVRRESFHRYPVVSRPSQPPCDTRHEEAPAA